MITLALRMCIIMVTSMCVHHLAGFNTDNHTMGILLGQLQWLAKSEDYYVHIHRVSLNCP